MVGLTEDRIAPLTQIRVKRGHRIIIDRIRAAGVDEIVEWIKRRPLCGLRDLADEGA